ncbi:hypothetical protein HPB52_024315 [Rhipicephalus sanguineus]|uniref:Generative cell specific-1/HAP2 domain-containing protein n=1 Tax=Rhipicephalus sanguineus TaxID=34632 RepID=A0A9D4YR80_RHISA|nr:hypothetical protein HPB52_024315 [Rhipicephalus sanguineus]
MNPVAAFLVIAAVTAPCALAFADVRMKALLAPCNNEAYEPDEVHNGLTKCKNKIQVTLLVNNTPGEKVASGEAPSPILLSYFKDKLPESPILFNETSGERFLSFIYQHPHLSLILLDINADDIVLLRQGTKGRINVVSAQSSDSASLVRIEVTNLGELTTIFSVQVTQCSHGVANSDTDSALVTPRRTLLLLTSVHFGALDIRDDLKCTELLMSSVCGNESLSCHLITELDALKAGLYKSRTTRSSDDRTSRDRAVQFIIYCLLISLAGDDSDGIIRPMSEVIIPTKLPNGRRTRSHT